MTVLACLGTGCTSVKKSTTELALDHISRKYGVEITDVSPSGSSMSGTRTLTLTAEGFDAPVTVEIENFRDPENMVIRDNFLAVKYHDEIQNWLQNQAEAAFGTARVLYETPQTGLTGSLPADAAFEDVLAGLEDWIYFRFFVRDSTQADSDAPAAGDSPGSAGLESVGGPQLEFKIGGSPEPDFGIGDSSELSFAAAENIELGIQRFAASAGEAGLDCLVLLAVCGSRDYDSMFPDGKESFSAAEMDIIDDYVALEKYTACVQFSCMQGETTVDWRTPGRTAER